jgi:hypothetical protein
MFIFRIEMRERKKIQEFYYLEDRLNQNSIIDFLT